MLAALARGNRIGIAVGAALLFGMILVSCGGSGSGLPSVSRPSTTVPGTSTLPGGEGAVTTTRVPSITRPTSAPTTSPERPAVAPTTRATEPPTTTTVAPTTTERPTPTTEVATTSPATPTTQLPTTSQPSASTEEPSTTSTIAPNATPAPTTSTTSSTPWGWILGAVLVAGLALAIVLILLARSRRAARAAWTAAARPALQEVASVRDLLQDPATRATTEGRESVDSQVSRAEATLDQLMTTAPDDVSRIATSTTASSLRGLLFAVEAERLLNSGDSPPTADQLVDADEAHRTRSRDLDAALHRLSALIDPESATTPSDT